jgi:hypothetical protein
MKQHNQDKFGVLPAGPAEVVPLQELPPGVQGQRVCGRQHTSTAAGEWQLMP